MNLLKTYFLEQKFQLIRYQCPNKKQIVNTATYINTTNKQTK
jgi:hypothetical protein